MKKTTLVVLFFAFVAFSLASQGIDLAGAQSDDQLRGGVQAYHRGFYSDSLVSLQKSLSIKPTNLLAQTWLGRVLWKSGFEQEALRTWQRLEGTGGADGLLQNWIEILRLRSGTARDIPREPAFVIDTTLDGSSKAGFAFKRPSAVRPRADGSFFIAAFGSNEILHFDMNFRLIEVFRGGAEGFDRPFDVLEASDGTLFVSEYGANRISRCNARGERLSSFGSTGRGDGALLGPQFLAADTRGFLYVTDWGNSRVVKYNPDGGFILSIPGLDGPSGVATRENLVFVSESGKKRVSIFDTDGNYLRSIGEGTLEKPEGLSFTPAGRLLVADSNKVWEVDVENEQWRVKADTGSQTKRLIQQAMTPNGDLLGVDFDQSRLVFLSDPVSLYSGYAVRVDRVDSTRFPDVSVDLSVEDRFGHPLVGLGIDNFILTESRRSVGTTTMVRTNSQVNTIDVALLVESSPAMAAVRSSAEQAAAELYARTTQIGRIKAVSAGERPVKETEFGEARLRFLEAAFKAAPSPQWRFDAAGRVAGEELITAGGGAKRAVVFLTSGSLGPKAFSTYSLTDIAAFMRNNAIAFYPVFLGSKGLDEDLAFLASETGGESYPVSTVGGMADVLRDIQGRTTPLYTVRYTSPSASEFGTRYIPLEVEVTIQKMSGRDECGYYAPAKP